MRLEGCNWWWGMAKVGVVTLGFLWVSVELHQIGLH